MAKKGSASKVGASNRVKRRKRSSPDGSPLKAVSDSDQSGKVHVRFDSDDDSSTKESESRQEVVTDGFRASLSRAADASAAFDVDSQSVHDDPSVQDDPADLQSVLKDTERYSNDGQAATTEYEQADKEHEEDEGLVPLVVPTAHGHGSVKPVRAHVPTWMARPTYVASDIEAGKVSLEQQAGALADGGVCGLSRQLVTRLRNKGIDHLFPVQAAVVPDIIAGFSSPYESGDVCVSAPTGSGKTLAYVLPIAQCLEGLRTRRLRAVVVVPTRALVSQVAAEFGRVAPSLAVAQAAGQGSLAKEARQLVHSVYTLDGNVDHFDSKADVLVCTPGRLVEHVQGTQGFALSWLRFLVIDEADRLLAQSYQRWLDILDEAMGISANSMTTPALHCGIARRTSRVQRILLSATLTADPSSLAKLRLSHPRLYLATSRPKSDMSQPKPADVSFDEDGSHFTLPPTLYEHALVCDPSEKPLVLLYLLDSLQLDRTLVFTNSVQAAHRLAILLKLFQVDAVEVSSSLKRAEVRKAVAKFAKGETHVLVCSDTLARGLDVEDVQNVISYDVPSSIKTYVHRVGRTARAGARGDSFAIMLPSEARKFRRLRSKVTSKVLSDMDVPEDAFEPYLATYQANLSALEAAISREARSGRTAAASAAATSDDAATGLEDTLEQQLRRSFLSSNL